MEFLQAMKLSESNPSIALQISSGRHVVCLPRGVTKSLVDEDIEKV